MKCPILHHHEDEVGDPNRWVMEDCLQEECAWWDKTRNNCVIEHLAYCLRVATEELVDIRHLMSKGGKR